MDNKQRWEDAAIEVHVREMDCFYGSDLQREPPFVVDKRPGARIFNWHLPAPARSFTTIIYNRTKQVGWYIKITISDSWFPVACHFLGHKPMDDSCADAESGYMGVTCERCGQHRGSYIY